MSQRKGPKKGAKDKVWEFTGVPALLKNTRTGLYWSRPKVQGRQEFTALDTDNFRVARARHARVMARVEQRRIQAAQGKPGRGGARTLADFIQLARDQAAANSSLAQNSKAAIHYSLLVLERTFPRPERPVHKIGPQDCLEWARRVRKHGTGFKGPGWKHGPRAGGISPSGYNKAVTQLRKIFRQAQEAGLVAVDPSRDLKRVAEGKKDPVLPTQKEFRDLLKRMRKGRPGSWEVAAAVAFSGMRPPGETGAFTWADVDWKGNRLRIRGTKTAAAARWVPMIPEMRKHLAGILEDRGVVGPDDAVFRVQKFNRCLAAACLDLGLERLTPYDLRHYFATRCVESGVDLKTLAAWMGHRDERMVFRTYAHLRDEFSQEMAARVSF